MKCISWFSGIGGFDLALSRLGHTIVGACEIDPFCRKVYARHFGAPEFFPADIEAVKPDDVPPADLWTAGSPCQGFSVAGKRGGLEDDRSGLLRTFVALVAAVRPTWLVLENVPIPGFLDVHGGRDFGEFTAALDELGYRWAWRVLDARFFGVPQRRRRVFVVGCLGDGRDPVPVLFEPEGRERDPRARVAARSSAARRSRSGPRDPRVAATLRAADGHHGRSSPRGDGSDTLVTALSASDGGVDDNDAAGGRLVTAPLTAGTKGQGHRISAEDAASGFLVTSEIAAPVTAKYAKQSTGPAGDEAANLVYAKSRHAHTDADVETWEEADVAPTLTETEARLGVLAFGSKDHGQDIGLDVSPTLRAAGGAHANAGAPPAVFNIVPESGQGADISASEASVAMALSTEEAKQYDRGTRVAEARGVRRLTPTECERLQGLPDGWTCVCGIEPYTTATCLCPDGPRYHAIGNGLAEPVVRWFLSRLPEEP